jgi:hypothetical protein
MTSNFCRVGILPALRQPGRLSHVIESSSLKAFNSITGFVLLVSLTACMSPPTPNASTPEVAPTSDSSPAPGPENRPDDSSTLSSEQQEAAQAIRDYYGAISAHDYDHAYSLWQGDGMASQQTFEEFKQGFAQTASVSVNVGEAGAVNGAAGSLYVEIPVTVTAVTTAGTRQQFCGSYTLRRVNDGARFNPGAASVAPLLRRFEPVLGFLSHQSPKGHCEGDSPEQAGCAAVL